MSKKTKLAIVGATGLVGRTIIDVLKEFNFENMEYEFFASSKSAGTSINLLGKDYKIKELKKDSFNSNFDFAIFSAGSSVAKAYAPIAVSKGTLVIDNSSAFRMYDNIPLVVPEVNSFALNSSSRIIANPNCSTIQAVVVLKPLDDLYKIKRIIYSTYQAVSGAGKKGIDDLNNTINGLPPQKFPYSIFNNCIPQIDEFSSNNYTKEELKMINETRKILCKPNLPITATTVRVPVLNCHSESINIEFENDFEINDIISTLAKSNGIIVQDDPKQNIYPIATNVTGHNEVYVGRIRRDFSVKSGINLWVVADNVRKGAATNAVQILKCILEKKIMEAKNEKNII